MHRIATLALILFSSATTAALAQEAKLSAAYQQCLQRAGGADPAMHDCMSAEYMRQDKRLNEVYQRVLRLQSPAQEKRLREAQQRWIAYTEANCQFYADPDRGTSARLVAHECSITARAARTDELERIPTMRLNEPAAPPVKLTRTERAQWFSRLKWPKSCEDAFQATFAHSGANLGGVEFYLLDANRYLAKVTCAGGAYQPSQIFMMYQPSQPASARPVQLKGQGTATKGEDAYVVWANATFDTKNKVLSVYNRSSGAGGCGLFVRYGFPATGEPAVLEARGRECTEKGNETFADPEKWPVVKL